MKAGDNLLRHAVAQGGPFRPRHLQAFAQISQPEGSDVLPGEHPGASSGQHHQTGNRVLQQFAPGNGGKISRQVHRAAGSRQRLLHPLCPRQIRQRQARRGAQPDRGIGIALRREPDHRRQHRRAAGQGGKLLALLNAVLQHAHHGVRGTQGRQPGGDGLRLGGFHRDKDQVEGGGYRHRVGVHRAGHHDLTLVSAQHQRRMGGTPADHRRPPPLKQGGGNRGADGAGTN